MSDESCATDERGMPREVERGTARGMILNAQIAGLLNSSGATTLPAFASGTPAEARASLLQSSKRFGEGPAVGSVVEMQIPGGAGLMAARLFRPRVAAEGFIVHVHGGGWALGCLDDFDALARTLVHRTNCSLLSFEYRLAPEHPFPAGLEDTKAAIAWAAASIAKGAVAGPLIVVGDSAGANLATVAINESGAEWQVALQVLFYPVTDCDAQRPSYLLTHDLTLTAADMQWFYRHYASPESWASPRISAVRATDLSSAAPAWISVAEFDVLRDEGIAYAKRLAGEGVQVELKEYAGLTHGFARMFNLVCDADRALDDASRAIRAACASAIRRM